MPKFSVKRPFLILVGVIIVLVLGGVSYSKMTTDLLPNMNMPYMMVITTYVGAAPEGRKGHYRTDGKCSWYCEWCKKSNQ